MSKAPDDTDVDPLSPEKDSHSIVKKARVKFAQLEERSRLAGLRPTRQDPSLTTSPNIASPGPSRSPHLVPNSLGQDVFSLNALSLSTSSTALAQATASTASQSDPPSLLGPASPSTTSQLSSHSSLSQHSLTPSGSAPSHPSPLPIHRNKSVQRGVFPSAHGDPYTGRWFPSSTTLISLPGTATTKRTAGGAVTSVPSWHTQLHPAAFGLVAGETFVAAVSGPHGSEISLLPLSNSGKLKRSPGYPSEASSLPLCIPTIHNLLDNDSPMHWSRHPAAFIATLDESLLFTYATGCSCFHSHCNSTCSCFCHSSNGSNSNPNANTNSNSTSHFGSSGEGQGSTASPSHQSADHGDSHISAVNLVTATTTLLNSMRQSRPQEGSPDTTGPSSSPSGRPPLLSGHSIPSHPLSVSPPQSIPRVIDLSYGYTTNQKSGLNKHTTGPNLMTCTKDTTASSSSAETISSTETHGTLEVIAVACSDGCVRVWSVHEMMHHRSPPPSSSHATAATALSSITPAVLPLSPLDEHKDIIPSPSMSPPSPSSLPLGVFSIRPLAKLMYPLTPLTPDATTASTSVTAAPLTPALIQPDLVACNPAFADVIAVAYSRGPIVIWDISTSSIIVTVSPPSSTTTVHCLDWSLCGTKLVTASSDRYIRVIDARTGIITSSVLNRSNSSRLWRATWMALPSTTPSSASIPSSTSLSPPLGPSPSQYVVTLTIDKQLVRSVSVWSESLTFIGSTTLPDSSVLSHPILLADSSGLIIVTGKGQATLSFVTVDALTPAPHLSSSSTPSSTSTSTSSSSSSSATPSLLTLSSDYTPRVAHVGEYKTTRHSVVCIPKQRPLSSHVAIPSSASTPPVLLYRFGATFGVDCIALRNSASVLTGKQQHTIIASTPSLLSSPLPSSSTAFILGPHSNPNPPNPPSPTAAHEVVLTSSSTTSTITSASSSSSSVELYPTPQSKAPRRSIAFSRLTSKEFFTLPLSSSLHPLSNTANTTTNNVPSNTKPIHAMNHAVPVTGPVLATIPSTSDLPHRFTGSDSESSIPPPPSLRPSDTQTSSPLPPPSSVSLHDSHPTSLPHGSSILAPSAGPSSLPSTFSSAPYSPPLPPPPSEPSSSPFHPSHSSQTRHASRPRPSWPESGDGSLPPPPPSDISTSDDAHPSILTLTAPTTSTKDHQSSERIFNLSKAVAGSASLPPSSQITGLRSPYVPSLHHVVDGDDLAPLVTEVVAMEDIGRGSSRQRAQSDVLVSSSSTGQFRSRGSILKGKDDESANGACDDLTQSKQKESNGSRTRTPKVAPTPSNVQEDTAIPMAGVQLGEGVTTLQDSSIDEEAGPMSSDEDSVDIPPPSIPTSETKDNKTSSSSSQALSSPSASTTSIPATSVSASLPSSSLDSQAFLVLLSTALASLETLSSLERPSSTVSQLITTLNELKLRLTTSSSSSSSSSDTRLLLTHSKPSPIPSPDEVLAAEETVIHAVSAVVGAAANESLPLSSVMPSLTPLAISAHRLHREEALRRLNLVAKTKYPVSLGSTADDYALMRISFDRQIAQMAESLTRAEKERDQAMRLARVAQARADAYANVLDTLDPETRNSKGSNQLPPAVSEQAAPSTTTKPPSKDKDKTSNVKDKDKDKDKEKEKSKAKGIEHSVLPNQVDGGTVSAAWQGVLYFPSFKQHILGPQTMSTAASTSVPLSLGSSSATSINLRPSAWASGDALTALSALGLDQSSSSLSSSSSPTTSTPSTSPTEEDITLVSPQRLHMTSHKGLPCLQSFASLLADVGDTLTLELAPKVGIHIDD